MGSWEAFRGRGLTQGEEVTGSQFPSRGQESLPGSIPSSCPDGEMGERYVGPMGLLEAVIVGIRQRMGDKIFPGPPVLESLVLAGRTHSTPIRLGSPRGKAQCVALRKASLKSGYFISTFLK